MALSVAGVLAPDGPPEAQTALLAAIGTMPVVPPELIPPLVEALLRTPEQPSKPILDVLGRVRSRDAVRPLIVLLASGNPIDPRARQAIVATLIAQTGHDELGMDVEAWKTWWDEVEWLPEPTWQQHLAQSHAACARRLRAQREALAASLLSVYQRLYVLTPEEQRSDLIAEMIRAPQNEIQTFGFELATRALLNARVLGDQVVEASAARLQSQSPSVRALAASLLERAGGQGQGRLIASALRAEQNEPAAAAMLRYLARWPQPDTFEAILRWLDNRATAAAAVEATLATLRAGFVPESEHGDLLEAVHAFAGVQETPALIRLFAELGELEVVSSRLSSDDPAIALAAAESLASHSASLDELIAAAEQNPQLAAAAIRALQQHRPTAASLELARRLVQTPAGGRVPASIIEFAKALPPTELLTAASAIETPFDRIALLEHVGNARYLTEPDQQDIRLSLITLLASSRLAIGEAASAVAAVDLVPVEQRTPDLREIRLRSLLRLGRIDEALIMQDANPVDQSIWIDVLAANIKRSFAAQLHGQIVAMFETSLSEAQRSQLQELSAEIFQPTTDGDSTVVQDGEPTPEPESPETPPGNGQGARIGPPVPASSRTPGNRSR